MELVILIAVGWAVISFGAIGILASRAVDVWKDASKPCLRIQLGKKLEKDIEVIERSVEPVKEVA